MKRLMAFVFVATTTVGAQELTLTTPVTYPSETKYRIRKIFQDATSALVQTTIEISAQSSGGAEIRYFNVSIPSPACGSATSATLETASTTARAGEPAGALARAQYRILGYLSDNGCGFPAHTLNQ